MAVAAKDSVTVPKIVRWFWDWDAKAVEVDVWNLPLIAAGLAELGLDWDAPLPAASSSKRTALPRFHLEDSAVSGN